MKSPAAEVISWFWWGFCCTASVVFFIGSCTRHGQKIQGWALCHLQCYHTSLGSTSADWSVLQCVRTPLNDGVSIITQWITCFDHVWFVWLRHRRGVRLSLSLSAAAGFVWQAGRQASPGFWPAVEAEFPVYFQRCVFILGDWGDCVSLKARPLPLPKCEMLRLGDAGLLLFVRTSLSQLGNPGQKVSAAFRGQEHAAFFEFLQQATTWEYILISSLIFLFYLF